MSQFRLDAIIYAFFLIFMVYGCVIGVYSNSVKIRTEYKKTSAFLYILLIFLIIYLGTSTGTDRFRYDIHYQQYVDGFRWDNSDKGYVGWNTLNYMLSRFVTSSSVFFLIISCVYVLANFWFCLKMSINYHILFIMVISCMGFRGYGVNTIKAGLALSIALVAFVQYYKDKKKSIVFSLISILIHSSCAIPILAFWGTGFFKKIKLNSFYLVWITCVGLSVVMGDFFKNILGGYLEDEELAGANYFLIEESHYQMGFRYDFLIYSFIPILWGWFLRNKHKYEDERWLQLYKTYILVNAFWVLVITMNFTDRVAYLSWFLIPYITLLPLLDIKKYQIRDRKKYIQLIMLLFGTFNIYMLFR